MRGRAHKVVQVPLHVLCLLQNVRDEFLAEEMARKALGRSPRQVGMAQPTLHDVFQTATLHGVFAARVIILAAGRCLTDETVEKQVTRYGYKPPQLLNATPSRKKDQSRQPIE